MEKEKKHFFDKPRNVKGLLIFLFGSCIVLLIIDFFIHKHGHFDMEEWPEFYATYGFVSCVILVLAAKYGLRKIVKRKEGYYD